MKKQCKYSCHIFNPILFLLIFRAFIKQSYLSKNKFPSREIYDFETTATDTNLVKNIFAVIQDIILSKLLASQGFE